MRADDSNQGSPILCLAGLGWGGVVVGGVPKLASHAGFKHTHHTHTHTHTLTHTFWIHTYYPDTCMYTDGHTHTHTHTCSLRPGVRLTKSEWTMPFLIQKTCLKKKKKEKTVKTHYTAAIFLFSISLFAFRAFSRLLAWPGVNGAFASFSFFFPSLWDSRFLPAVLMKRHWSHNHVN